LPRWSLFYPDSRDHVKLKQWPLCRENLLKLFITFTGSLVQ
jgi:hypothetical protein